MTYWFYFLTDFSARVGLYRQLVRQLVNLPVFISLVGVYRQLVRQPMNLLAYHFLPILAPTHGYIAT